MRTAQWTLLPFLAAVLTVGGVHFYLISDEGLQNPAEPMKGDLAPVLDPSPPKIERTRLPETPGRLIDLDAEEERIVVLTRNGWLFSSGEDLQAWHGETTAGSPNWLSSPESIALDGEVVFVLESQRSILSVWDTTGARLGEVRIPLRRDLAQRPTRVIVGPSGRPVVVLQGMDQDGTGYWEILELGRDGMVTGFVSLPSTDRTAIYQEPQLAVRGPALLAMSTLSQELWAVDLEHGQLHPVAKRRAPPLWPIPREERRKHDRVLARMSEAMASLAQLPDYWPSVREFTVLDDGTILQATSAGEVAVQIEQLTSRLEPLGRANPSGFSQPVFLTRGRAFVAEETVEETLIYEIVF